MNVIDGEPPHKPGHYWLRIETTEKCPVEYSISAHAWKCDCHPDSLHGLTERISKNLKLGLMQITGYVSLPDFKTK